MDFEGNGELFHVFEQMNRMICQGFERITLARGLTIGTGDKSEAG